MLDAFDVMLFALVLPRVMADLALDASTAGAIGSATLVSAAIGGIGFGLLADRWGRTRALLGSVLIYSVFTAACGLAQNAVHLLVFRVLLGLGMGGEWASGAALVSETWPDDVRGRALAFMQSAWAVGYGLAAVVAFTVQDLAGLSWRWVFFVGLVPAFVTVWLRRRTEESTLWRQTRNIARGAGLPGVSAGRGERLLGITVALTLMNAGTLFAWWGFNTWMPAYLSRSAAEGGAGFSPAVMAAVIVVMQVGMWFGYVTFGFVSDAVGRKRTYVTYLVLAAVSVFLFTSTRQAGLLLALGPITAFFGTGYFSGFGTVTAELYSTHVRATAQGLTYNLGRIASAAAPWVLGGYADAHGYASALMLPAAAFLFSAACWVAIPETRGRTLEPA